MNETKFRTKVQEERDLRTVQRSGQYIKGFKLAKDMTREELIKTLKSIFRSGVASTDKKIDFETVSKKNLIEWLTAIREGLQELVASMKKESNADE